MNKSVAAVIAGSAITGVLVAAAAASTAQAVGPTIIVNGSGSQIEVTRVWGGHDNVRLWEVADPTHPYSSTTYYRTVEGFKSVGDARCVQVSGPAYRDGYARVDANHWQRVKPGTKITVRSTTTGGCNSRTRWFSYNMA